VKIVDENKKPGTKVTTIDGTPVDSFMKVRKVRSQSRVNFIRFWSDTSVQVCHRTKKSTIDTNRIQMKLNSAKGEKRQKFHSAVW